MATSTIIKIRGYHCDAYGHVNNARYLEILEEARWRLLEEHDIIDKINNLGYLFFVVHIDIGFKKPVMNGTEVRVVTRMSRYDKRRIMFEQKIMREGNDRPYAVAEVSFVLFDEAKEVSVPITEKIVSLFKPINQ